MSISIAQSKYEKLACPLSIIEESSHNLTLRSGCAPSEGSVDKTAQMQITFSSDRLKLHWHHHLSGT